MTYKAGDRVLVDDAELATVTQDAGEFAVWVTKDNDPGVAEAFSHSDVEKIRLSLYQVREGWVAADSAGWLPGTFDSAATAEECYERCTEDDVWGIKYAIMIEAHYGNTSPARNITMKDVELGPFNGPLDAKLPYIRGS